VDSDGRPCKNPPVQAVQEIDGRCRHHGDNDGEPSRKARGRSYKLREAKKQAWDTFKAAQKEYGKAQSRVAKEVLAARPAFDDLAIAKDRLEKARQTCEELGEVRIVLSSRIATLRDGVGTQ
jgi:uncharacterized membrane protein